jgi:MFS family permease
VQRLQLSRPDLGVGAIMIVVLMGTALVSPLYPLYQAEWALSAGQVTLLYVTYMSGALTSLLVFGRLADQIGFGKVIGGALGLALAGTCLTLCAPDYLVFCFARFLVGIAASLVTTAGTLAVINLAPERSRQAVPLLTSLFVSIGFALGPILGGMIGQWAPNPLVVAHLPSAALLLASVVVFLLIPKRGGRGGFTIGTLLPRLSWTTNEHSIRFALGCCLPFLGFGIFGLYASLAPMLVQNFIGLSGPAIRGLYIGTFLVGTMIFQIAARRVATRKAAVIALLLMALGNLIMWANLSAGSVILFVAGVCIASAGHGFCLLSSTTIMHQSAIHEKRGALAATYWAIGYSGSIFPLLLLGWASDRWGMQAAVTVFCAAAAMLCLTIALLFVVQRPAAS